MKAVYLEWQDSSSERSEGVWKDREAVATAGEPCHCETIGFILAEDKKSITVAGHLTIAGRSVSGDMNIPKSAIVKRRVVRWKK